MIDFELISLHFTIFVRWVACNTFREKKVPLPVRMNFVTTMYNSCNIKKLACLLVFRLKVTKSSYKILLLWIKSVEGFFKFFFQPFLHKMTSVLATGSSLFTSISTNPCFSRSSLNSFPDRSFPLVIVLMNRDRSRAPVGPALSSSNSISAMRRPPPFVRKQECVNLLVQCSS